MSNVKQATKKLEAEQTERQPTAADRVMSHKDIEVPFGVWNIIGDKVISLHGDQMIFSPDGDCANLENARKAIEWYVIQLNGTVTWK